MSSSSMTPFTKVTQQQKLPQLELLQQLPNHNNKNNNSDIHNNKQNNAHYTTTTKQEATKIDHMNKKISTKLTATTTRKQLQ